MQSFCKMKNKIDEFNPDFILMFDDDQYENFTEDIIPTFRVRAYDDLTSYSFKRCPTNVWGEPEDHPITTRSKPNAARWLASRFLEEGGMSYAYQSLPWIGLGHAFINIQMYLDYDRQGFDYPVIPIQVNSTAARFFATNGL